MHNSKVQFIQQQQQPLDNLNRSRTIKCYTINADSNYRKLVHQNVKQNQIRTCKSLYLHNTNSPTIVVPVTYWYQRWYLQIVLLLGITLMGSIITPTVINRYNHHVLALQPHHYYWWSNGNIDTIRPIQRVSISASLYRRYVHHQQQRIQKYLYNQWQHFHTNTPTTPPIGRTANTVPMLRTVRPLSARITTAIRYYSTTDDTGSSHPSDDEDTISTVSMIDWNRLIYDAFIEMETDGIQQLGKNVMVVNDYEIDESDDNNIGNSGTGGDHIDKTIQKNPIQHLSPNELWKITQQTAQKIALFKKKSNYNNKVIRKQSIDKINSNSDENANVPWTGIAASMLNGWIAACGSSSACSINHDGMNISSINDYCKQRAMYAEELFHIATTGQNNVHKQMSSKKKLTITNNSTLVVPDVVTYSLLYNIMIPINIEQAKYYLNLAQQQSKKIAGTQRRKLVTKLSTSRPILKTESKSMMFRDYESDLQNLLFPEMKNNATNDVIYLDSNRKPFNLILYENDDYMVINKPSGVCCYHTHVTTAGKRNIDLSIVDVLQKVRTGGPQHILSLSTLNPSAFGIVHRLDRGTSGCLIIAKNDATHATIVSRLFQRQIQKTYTVLVSPAPCIELYNTTGYITIPVHGKSAKSKYTIIERFVRNNTSILRSKNGTSTTISNVETAALMNITTYTGRQHQVRVHCSFGLGTPIIGDTVYTTSATTNKINAMKGKNDRPINTDKKREQFHLHASSISLFDPTTTAQNCNNNNDTLLIFDAPIPNWWLPVLEEWRV